MTPEERRAQVKAALIEAIKVVLRTPSWPPGPYRPLSERIATAILALRDPDGEPMVMVRDLDQTPPASRCSFNLHKGGVTRIVEVPDADEYRQRGFVKCIRPFEAKGKS